MPNQYWLVKQEPTAYPFGQLQADGRTAWTGVRNHQARNNLAAMKAGDPVLYYHSVVGCAVVGLCKVVREAYADPTADDPRWLAVDIAPLQALATPVELSTIKADPTLQDIALVRQSRLSVLPLEARAYERIVALGSGKTSGKRAAR